NFTALLLAPPGLLENWKQEAKKFIGLERVTIVDTSKGHDWRVAGTQLYLASAMNTSAYRDQVICENFDCLIFDECHLLRNPGTVVTMDVKLMSKTIPMRLLISGSPAVKIIHLFSIMNIIAPEEFDNYFTFGNRYCRVWKNTPSGREAVYDTNVCFHVD